MVGLGSLVPINIRIGSKKVKRGISFTPKTGRGFYPRSKNSQGFTDHFGISRIKKNGK
jgi:hypothetical protein